MKEQRNWAGNYKYSADELHIPENIEQIQQLVTRCNSMRVLGTRHSFNGIADHTENLISLENFNQVLGLDSERRTVTVEAGIKYSDLCRYLHRKGYALENMASLPHISVAGACATATHGSGDQNRGLATSVSAMEIVSSDGDVIEFSRERSEEQMNGAVVGLGGAGVVTTLTLDVVPSYNIRQDVYENLALSHLKNHFDDIFSSAYSVSLFTDWKDETFNQVWLKSLSTEQSTFELGPEFFGAKAASKNLHPVPGSGTENCTEQMGIPGPWLERLSHFRMDFTPSHGKELQSEYIVPREHAYDALCAISQIREQIAPLLFISETRTIAQDDLWMSPCYKQESVAFHFTWKDDWESVQKVLPKMEEQLAPFLARPHWGKLFTMPSTRVQSLYEKLPDFQQLLQHYDPKGKFRNKYLNTYIF
ncbi:FAD-binding protein [Salipaludibacillus neizhouensis]|uniref:FAD-binding protein n=1 Tax=Salipaludibacillus neizhouensis TaxID=885475 RepID=A0A3A9KB57_9BACI|nr:FAD-binding protein [Salipaludibacillus neizhouensis]RKL67990.1 FAD-binding protein [Salipaludibacillus neizhouensis]